MQTQVHQNVESLFPVLLNLKRQEKFVVLQFLISDLHREEEEIFTANAIYPIWSPYEAYEAAFALEKLLQESENQ